MAEQSAVKDRFSLVAADATIALQVAPLVQTIEASI